MLESVKEELSSSKYNTAILSAAAADYGASGRKMEKTPSGKDEWVIKLKPLPKIVENVKKVDPEIYLVGFKAEYDISDKELVERAYNRLIGAGMDLIVANDVSREKTGFGTDTNEVFLIDKQKNVQHVDLVDKYIVAARVLDIVRDNI